MGKFLDIIIECCKLEERMVPTYLEHHKVGSIIMAEHLDREEYDHLNNMMKESGREISEIVSWEYGHPAEKYEFGSDIDVFSTVIFDWSHKDILISYGDDVVLWLPGSYPWYVIFFAQSAREIIAPLHAPAVERYKEWLEEDHQSVIGRQSHEKSFLIYNAIDRASTNNKSDVVCVKLMNEAVEVYRPVKAERISDEVYRLLPQTVPEGEDWEFSPGTDVVVEPRSSKTGEYLAAVKVSKAE